LNAVIPIKPERAHAKLSASGSKKWLTCTPSAHLEDQFPDEGSQYADEGTFAHEVFECLISFYAGKTSVKECNKRHAALKADARWNKELDDHVVDAVLVAKERIAEARERCKDPVILVEQRLDFSQWVPEGFGTGDLVIITDGLVEVMDYKHGKGVFVEAQDNSQMRLYGLGAYSELAHLYDIQRVRMTVLQPRLSNFGSEELVIDELLHWAEGYVQPRASLAWKGDGVFVPGDHCSEGFCRARFHCAARAEHAMTLAKSDFALTEPKLLTQDQICEVLAKGDAVAKWISDVQGYALEQAEKHARQWPGFKLVEGRSNRKYADPDVVAQRLLSEGVEEAVIYERSLLGITAMEKAIGKKKFAELLNDLVVKPQGKPTLVPVDDKRPALSSVASAAADFS
jgi:hypothetical protein